MTPFIRDSEIQQVELDDLDELEMLETNIHSVEEVENPTIFRLSTLIMIGLLAAGIWHKSEQ